MKAGWKNEPSWIVLDKMIKEERMMRRHARMQWEAEQEMLRQKAMLAHTVTANMEKPQ